MDSNRNLGDEPKVIIYQLYFNQEARPIHQQKRKFPGEKNEVIKRHVAAFKEVGVIKEANYPSSF